MLMSSSIDQFGEPVFLDSSCIGFLCMQTLKLFGSLIAGCILRQNIRILDSIKNQFEIILKVFPDIEPWLGHRSQPHPKGNMNSCNHSQGSAKANASLVFQSITYKCVLHISNSCCNWCRVSHISRCYEKIYMK